MQCTAASGSTLLQLKERGQMLLHQLYQSWYDEQSERKRRDAGAGTISFRSWLAMKCGCYSKPCIDLEQAIQNDQVPHWVTV